MVFALTHKFGQSWPGNGIALSAVSKLLFGRGGYFRQTTDCTVKNGVEYTGFVVGWAGCWWLDQ